MPTPRLYSLADSLRRQLHALLGEPQFTTPVEEIPAEEYHPQVAEWNP